MALNFISLGLFDKNDLSINAINTIKNCDVVYIERYTNYFDTSTEELEKFLNKKIRELTRQDLENNSDKILENAKTKNIALLIPGEVFAATTHISLFLEARKLKIKTNIIHGSSIFTAISETGLSLYRFGQVTSIPFDNKNITSPFNVLKQNLKQSLHTLFLLDIKENKYMNAKEAINFLLKKNKIFAENSLCIVCSALGSGKKEIVAGKVKKILRRDFNKFPQCLIVPAKLNFMEEEVIKIYQI